MSFHYKDITPWDRSLDEYLDMFNLSEDDLARDIVGNCINPKCANHPNQELPLLCRCFGKVFNESIRPIYSPITAVAIEQKRAMVIPSSTNRRVPVSNFFHVLKFILE